MALTIKSLDAVVSIGAGSPAFFDTPKSNISMYVEFTGSPSSRQVDLEGTVDGVTWLSLASVTGFQGLVVSAGKPMIGMRANCLAMGGGTSPTVTASLAAA